MIDEILTKLPEGVFALRDRVAQVLDAIKEIEAGASEPTTKTFDSEYLREELELPMCAEYTKLIDHNRWSVIKECVFRTDDMPEGFFWMTTYSQGATESQSEEPWEYVDEVKCTLVRRGTKTVDAWIPAVMPEGGE
jgi:hypothetical protein